MAGRAVKVKIGVLLLLLLGFPIALRLYTDYLWFQSMGYAEVFLTVLSSKLALAGAGALLLFLFAFSNAYVASRSYGVSKTRGGETEILVPQGLDILFIAVMAVSAVLFALYISRHWELLLRFLNRQPFGVAEPVFGRDVSFYVFELPFYETLLRMAFFILLFSGVLTALIYLLKSGSIIVERALTEFRFEPPTLAFRARAHLLSLLALFFFLLAISYRLQGYELLFSHRSNAFFGPGYTDMSVALPALKALALLALLAGLSVLLNLSFKRPLLPIALVALLIIVHLLVLNGYASLVQEYRVAPNEIALESPYILNNIRYTSLAFGLDNVGERDFKVSPNLTAEELEENSPTITNIRLWDPRPLKDTYKQLQEIRLYYEFNDVDVDRYELDGEYVELMVSPREIEPKQLPPNARNWINEHLVYTHGYGVVATPVNRATPEGLPELLVKDIPPESRHFEIERPEIYFGELTKSYVIVNTRQEEFDYPRGNENSYTTYQGDAGVELSSYLRKVAMALRFGTAKILLSRYITSESRILFNRDIRSIVTTIAPFFIYDRDPYVVMAGGRLKWIVDGYTVTDRYPYSTPYRGVSYIRNSVKVVIDAYSGETTFYLADPSDPLGKAYSEMFPALFKPLSEMPGDLKKHLRYPEDLFTLQAEVYAKYHMKDPRVFYNLEDMWNFPRELYESRRIVMQPYYIIMKLPEEEREEFLLMLPFTPRNKDNMIAWMYARSDPGYYGELGVFKFPKKELVFGPAQIEARIDQDERISEQLTLWGQVGSRVIRGNLLVIPVENSILYVEPLYLLAEQSKLPELKRVIVAYGDNIVMEEELGKALAEIFGRAEQPQARAGGERAAPALIEEALGHYEKAMEELRAGNWSGFGEELERLGSALLELNRSRAKR